MKKSLLLIFAFLFIQAYSKNIYFGPGQKIAIFAEAFARAKTGDYLIKSRVDTIRFDSGLKWLSFPALDNVYSTPDYDPDQAAWLLYDIIAQDFLDWVSYKYGDFVNKISGIWYGTENIFSKTEGYKFQMNTAATLEIGGFKEPDVSTISLVGNQEDNWVGYWLEETQSVDDAFSDYWDGLNINSIQHQYWTAVYALGVWWYKVSSGHEPTLSYGDMVVVKCNNTISNFQWDNSTPPDPDVKFSEPEYFAYEEQADYVPLYIELDKNNMPQEIGAFVNGICIGATVVEDTLTQINAYTASAPPGNIEIELYYNSRSANQTLSKYNFGSFENTNVVYSQINTAENTNAWFVSLREDTSIIPVPDKVSLTNYPNPFNPTTTISYALPYEDNISLCIYNVKGQLVKQLVEGIQPEGYYDIVWNGKDSAGRKVASGIYYYRINACSKTINKKMLMLK